MHSYASSSYMHKSNVIKVDKMSVVVVVAEKES
jgi:hypothetical protein